MSLLEIKENCIKKSAYYLLQNFKNPFNITDEDIKLLKNLDKLEITMLEKFPPQITDLFLHPDNFTDFTFFLYWKYIIFQCNGL